MVLPFRISEAKKKAGQYCAAYACRNSPNPKKGGLCNTHYTRKRRALDPIYTRYGQFKGNAKARNKDFSITIEQFIKFCERTGYLIEKGKRGQNATIDRRCNAQGYHIFNIQLLSNRQNASKGDGFSGDNFERCDPEDLPF